MSDTIDDMPKGTLTERMTALEERVAALEAMATQPAPLAAVMDDAGVAALSARIDGIEERIGWR
jgi:hypothetical protein